jgi:hypothetical protein
MIMRLKPRRGGPEKTMVIASFREEGRGVRVFDGNGKDMGYFGPEEYEKIILGSKAPEPDTAGELDHS